MFDIMNQELHADESEDELFDENVLQKLKFQQSARFSSGHVAN